MDAEFNSYNVATEWKLKDRYLVSQFPFTSGEYSDIFRGVDTDGVICTVKKLKPEFHNRWDRFANEASVLRKLIRERPYGPHRQIPRLIDSFDQDGFTYLIHEYIPGAAIVDVPEWNNQWSIKDSEELLENLLTIAQYIHTRGFVHCDIKPQHIIRRPPGFNPELGRYALIGFGSARSVNAIINTTQISGSPSQGYRYKKDDASPNNDLYDIGLIAAMTATGLPAEDLEKYSQGSIELPAHIKASSPQLFNVIARLTDKSPLTRYQRAFDALRDLKAARPVINLNEKKQVDWGRIITWIVITLLLCGVAFMVRHNLSTF